MMLPIPEYEGYYEVDKLGNNGLAWRKALEQ